MFRLRDPCSSGKVCTNSICSAGVQVLFHISPCQLSEVLSKRTLRLRFKKRVGCLFCSAEAGYLWTNCTSQLLATKYFIPWPVKRILYIYNHNTTNSMLCGLMLRKLKAGWDIFVGNSCIAHTQKNPVWIANTNRCTGLVRIATG